MARVLVAGLINIETTLKVDAFPLAYEPVRYPFFGVAATVSGVGFNVAKALTRLGHDVVFASLVGRDAAAREVSEELSHVGVDTQFVLPDLASTPRSVILYEPGGRRMIHVDLKDIQDHPYPSTRMADALEGVDLAVVCNINFARPFLEGARQRRIPIATDVHAIANPDDDYNRDFMQNADILFCSHEKLPSTPHEWLVELRGRYAPRLAVVGMGAQGALLLARDKDIPEAASAQNPRPIENTIGAGDALFSSFLDGHLRGRTPIEALRRAALYAGWKIGEKGAAEGLLTAEELDRLETSKLS